MGFELSQNELSVFELGGVHCICKFEIILDVKITKYQIIVQETKFIPDSCEKEQNTE